jgi:methyl-accepting chemotaxis protein
MLVGCSALGLLLVAGMGIYQTERVYMAANFGNENTVPALVALGKVNTGVEQTRLGIYRHVFIGTDAAKMADIDRKLEEAENMVRSGLKLYEPTIVDNKDRKRFDNVSGLFKDYVAGTSNVLASSRANKKDEAKALIPTLADKGFKLDEAVAEYIDYNINLGNKATADAKALQTSAIVHSHFDRDFADSDCIWRPARTNEATGWRTGICFRSGE